MSQTIVIIGGGAGGMTTATQVKKQDPNLRVVVFEKGPYVSWAGCPTPYYIAGKLEWKSIVHYEADYFINNRNIEIYINHQVEEIDFDRKKITVKGDQVNGEFEYDKLVVSTGSYSFIPDMKGIEDKNDLPEGAFILRNPLDAKNIKDYIAENSPKHSIIIGGGFVGMELAEGFAEMGLNPTVVEKSDGVYPFLSGNLQRKRIELSLRDHGVNLITNNSVTEIITESGKISKVVLENGETLDCDLLMITIGIRPNLDLLIKSGYPLENNRLTVNEYLETKIKDVYALGDMIYTKHLLTGKEVYAPFGDVADKQGIVLGNVLAGKPIKYNGVMGTASTTFFEWQIAKTGLTLQEASDAGFNAAEIEVKSLHRVSGFPDTVPGVVRAVYDKDEMILLGATIVSQASAAQFIDQFSIVILHKTPIEDLMDIDFAYSPSTSVVWNPLLAVYRKVLNR